MDVVNVGRVQEIGLHVEFPKVPVGKYPEAHFHLKLKTLFIFHHEMDGDTLIFGFKSFLLNATSISFLFGLSPFFQRWILLK